MTGAEPTAAEPTAAEPTAAEPTAAEPYQSLYRRFRPQHFSEVLGQEFVSLALRNAVREDHVGHAYLFSGPRGTGKTSTARILAKALNCAAPVDGEPCGVCMSCVEIAAGSSLDVHELDAASNNGVDAMRDLVSRAALGTPGRWKVYIVDEVHMLSAAASNALLKTLEEPPAHVVFVLATTDPQKVLQTIKSRTQHFEFRLIGPETLHELLETIRVEAKLDLPEHAIEMAVSRGRGSARDALSVLDQVAAAGMVEPDMTYLAELAEALATRDAQAALVALASAVHAGRDPLLVAGELADHLRQGFLAVVAPELVTIDSDERAEVNDLATKMGLPALVRAVEALGTVQVDMRESPDPRLHVEVCLLRLTRSEVDDSLPGLLERVERLERNQSAGAAQVSPVQTAPVQTPPAQPTSGAAQSSPADHPKHAQHPHSPVDDSGSGLYAAPTTAEASDPAALPATTTSGSGSGPALARRSLGAIRREAAARRGEPDKALSDKAPSNTAPSDAAPSDAAPSDTALSDTASSTSDHSPRATSSTEDESHARGDEGGAEKTAEAGTGSAETASGSPSEHNEKESTTTAGFPTRDELVQVWGDGLLASLPQRARARFRVGRFMEVHDGVAVFALPNEAHRSYCEEVTKPVEAALAARFGVQVKLRLITDPDEEAGGRRESPRDSPHGGTALVDELAPPDGDEPDLLDPHVLEAETEPAGDALSPAERLKLTFPGAKEV